MTRVRLPATLFIVFCRIVFVVVVVVVVFFLFSLCFLVPFSFNFDLLFFILTAGPAAAVMHLDQNIC